MKVLKWFTVASIANLLFNLAFGIMYGNANSNLEGPAILVIVCGVPYVILRLISKKKDMDAQPIVKGEQQEINEQVIALQKEKDIEQITKGAPENKQNNKQIEALQTLKELHDDGVITDDEYTKKKKQILGI